MGATVFLQACAWMVPLSNGTRGYIWSEETYDKKDGPKNARWCTMAIGNKERIIKRVFALAQSLPGGMLQTPSQISVPGFIKKYLDLVENPVDFEPGPITIQNSNKGFYDAITDKNRTHVCRIFEQFGKVDWADAARVSVVNGGKNIVANSTTDFEVLAALTHERHKPGDSTSTEPVVYPWQLLQLQPYHGKQIVAKKNSSQKVDMLPPKIEVFKHRFTASNSDITAAVVDGKTFMGADWEVERDLISFASEMESTSPGYYRVLLTSFKKSTAYQFEKACYFQFDTTHLSDDDWLVERLNKITQVLFGDARRSVKLTFEEIEELGKRSVNEQYWAVRMLDNPNVCKLNFAFADTHQETLF
jgi:hypothetical protein